MTCSQLIGLCVVPGTVLAGALNSLQPEGTVLCSVQQETISCIAPRIKTVPCLWLSPLMWVLYQVCPSCPGRCYHTKRWDIRNDMKWRDRGLFQLCVTVVTSNKRAANSNRRYSNNSALGTWDCPGVETALNLYSPVVTIYTISFIITRLYILPSEYLCVLFMILTVNTACFHQQY
jgi:hypothetical protein